MKIFNHDLADIPYHWVFIFSLLILTPIEYFIRHNSLQDLSNFLFAMCFVMGFFLTLEIISDKTDL